MSLRIDKSVNTLVVNLGPSEARAYRMLLMTQLVCKARDLGLWTKIPPSIPPDPKCFFNRVMEDLIHLAQTLPVLDPQSTYEHMRQPIAKARRGCRSALVRSISTPEMYGLLLEVQEKVKTHKKTPDDAV